MPSYTEEVCRDVRRDFATKARLARGVAPFLNFAADAAEAEKVEEMSAREFALKCLKKLGLISNGDSPRDPVSALEQYLAGRKQGADVGSLRERSSATDSAEGSFVDRYIEKGAA